MNADDNDLTRFEHGRRRDLEGFLADMDELAAALEIRQQVEAPSARQQQLLGCLDRLRAQVRDMLAGRLPLDAYIPIDELP
jgi:hypothetical protein